MLVTTHYTMLLFYSINIIKEIDSIIYSERTLEIGFFLPINYLLSLKKHVIIVLWKYIDKQQLINN
jgi:hypothetical protein